jgi:hypothetical protein
VSSKLISKLFVLSALIVTLYLSRPTPAYAFQFCSPLCQCLKQCFNQRDQCIREGLQGCELLYELCVQDCES